MPKIKRTILFAIAASLLLLPLHATVASSESSLSLGYKAYRDNGFEKAIEYLEAAKNDDRLLSDYALYYLGESYLSLSRTDEALNAFTACINYNPDSPLKSFAMEKAGDIYHARGDEARAIDTYKEILAGHPDGTQTQRTLYKIASILLNDNKYDEALPFIKRLLTEFPQAEYNDDSFASQILSSEIGKLSADEFSARAKGLLRIRNHERAIGEIRGYLSEAASWFPYDVPLKRNDKFRLLLGQAFYQARNYKKAGETFKELFSNADDYKIRQESLICLARNYIKQKDTKSAGNVLKALISVYTDRNLRDEAIYRLAMIAKDEGDANLSVAFFKQLMAESPSSSYKDDALWQTGWMHYKQGDLEKSLETLKSLENSSLKMRALYWQGKINLMIGKKDNARRLFKIAIDNFPINYYSVMSKKEMEKNSGYELRNVNFKSFNPEIPALNPQLDEPLHVQRARRLLEIGANDLALKELASVDYTKHKMNIILLYKKAGDFYRSYIMARRLSYDSPDFSYQLVYPEAYKDLVERVADEFGIDPFLIYAVMMQESEFDARAVSSAGAIGLLQIMPATGEMIARKLPYQSFKEESLFEPGVNINFGAWYLKTLIARFNGKLPLAVAAYNAGPNAVDEWLKKWGAYEMDEFVENIPYQETRKYVEKVIGYYEAYKEIYASDLEANIGGRIAGNEE